MTEIVLLAMVALFVGLRLYSVLGRRTGHEQQPILRPAETAAATEAPAPAADLGADSSFDVARFLEGAQAAYRMILDAFWRGDREELRHLVGGDVLATFEEAITAREEAGEQLDNRLVQIERAVISDARLAGRTAEVDVRFDADIAAVTRDREGKVIAGTLSDAIPTHDVWTFRRNLASGDPNWLLVETDEAD